MPKPKFGINGSGMHLNMSISRDGINVFQDAKDEYGLSKEAYCFIGGIMKHMKALTFITNPSINSYKRLIPGYEAPGIHRMVCKEPYTIDPDSGKPRRVYKSRTS